MKPFRTNLKLVINKYLFGMNYQFSVVETSDNNLILSDSS